MFLRPLLLFSFSPSNFSNSFFFLYLSRFIYYDLLVELNLLVGTCITDTAHSVSSAYTQPNPGLWSGTAFPFINTHTVSGYWSLLSAVFWCFRLSFCLSIRYRVLLFFSIHMLSQSSTFVELLTCLPAACVFKIVLS